MSSRTILIETDAAGNFTYEQPCFAMVLALKVNLGDLDTPDVTVDDANEEITFGQWTGLASDAFLPEIFTGCSGTLRVTVANGGDTKHGSVRVLLWG